MTILKSLTEKKAVREAAPGKVFKTAKELKDYLNSARIYNVFGNGVR